MKCEEVTVLMQRELDHDLTDSERGRMLAHLEQCPDCTAIFERLRSLSLELERLPKVFPPISIVDSILPKLAQIVPDSGESAGIPVMNEEFEPALLDVPAIRERKPVPWFSWRLAGGAAAAAVLLAVFVFHSGTPKSDSAEEIAISADRISAKADRNATASSAEKIESAGSMPQSTDQTKPAENAPTASVPSPANTFHENTDNAESKDVSDLAKRSGQNAPNSGTASRHSESQAALPAASPSVSAGGSGSAPKAEAPAQATGTRDVNAPTVTPSPGQLPAASPEVLPEEETPDLQNTHMDQASLTDTSDDRFFSFAQQATPAPGSPSPTATPKPSEPAAKMKIVTAPSVTAPPRVNSPSGGKSAFLADGHLVIVDSNGNPVFKSASEWKVPDTVTFSWRSDTVLAYSVVHEDGSKINYVIDLEKKTEQTEVKP